MMTKTKLINILIIHYNTPKLTECLIRSINKFTPKCVIYIFDNSDKEPFIYRQDNIIYLDNTKGQYINFDEWLEKYPNRKSSRVGVISSWGSAKHCYSVEKCMELINDNFILLDDDILLKKDITNLFDERYFYVGQVGVHSGGVVKRVLPYMCFINTKLCKENGIHYFNENYMHGLCKNMDIENYDIYDTGAYFYLECKNKPNKEINIREYIEHCGASSYFRDKDYCERWLNNNKKYWN